MKKATDGREARSKSNTHKKSQFPKHLSFFSLPGRKYAFSRALGFFTQSFIPIVPFVLAPRSCERVLLRCSPEWIAFYGTSPCKAIFSQHGQSLVLGTKGTINETTCTDLPSFRSKEDQRKAFDPNGPIENQAILNGGHIQDFLSRKNRFCTLSHATTATNRWGNEKVTRKNCHPGKSFSGTIYGLAYPVWLIVPQLTTGAKTRVSRTMPITQP